ncbi:peroxiredoxin [Actinosynnema sp. ALI-1.44]|uniref:peroxiredoxin-like family protein n=1 Tax=Actinosynnema sp. ALI-1.44 TaxID=1933779 RepID=UPI00097C5FA7|nr:peroxiredoxin-like family protein [Actinosynnema sp. ALI-1.44]ONI87026.1 peroxiredoxin [Actinosynnema sp. ALI-1.44]
MTTTEHTIAEQVEAMQQDMGRQIPDEVLAAFGSEQASLDAAGVPDGVATPGTAMPDGDLLDAHGTSTTLTAARNGKPAVVVTYRGAWCPYCNITLRTYQDQLVPALAERGVELIALSPQKPDGSLSMAEKNDLTFTVLSDPGNQIAGKLGVLTAPTADARRAQETMGIDLPAVNADESHGIPMPTVVIVDADGTIRWIDVHPNYTTRTETVDIITALRRVL